MAAWGPAAGAVIGGAAQVYGAEQAAKESREAMRRATQQRYAAKEYLEGIDPTKLEGLNVDYTENLLPTVGEDMYYDPEMQQYIQAADPVGYQYLGDVEATQIQDSPEMRAAQAQALSDMQRRSEEGLSAQEQAQFIRSRRQAGEMARGREGAIMEQMQARGMAGSGMEAALRQMASQQESGRLSESMAGEAAVAARERARAGEAQFAGAGQMRGADIALSEGQANILNRFAMENSARQQQIRNMNIQQQNQALQQATDEQRRLQSANVGSRNQAQMQNISMQQQRQSDLNAILREQATARNEKLLSQYDAGAQQAERLSAAELGHMPDIYAGGAAEAAKERAKWAAIGGVAESAGQYSGYGGGGDSTPKQQTQQQSYQEPVSKPFAQSDDISYSERQRRTGGGGGYYA